MRTRPGVKQVVFRSPGAPLQKASVTETHQIMQAAHGQPRADSLGRTGSPERVAKQVRLNGLG